MKYLLLIFVFLTGCLIYTRLYPDIDGCSFYTTRRGVRMAECNDGSVWYWDASYPDYSGRLTPRWVRIR